MSQNPENEFSKWSDMAVRKSISDQFENAASAAALEAAAFDDIMVADDL